jgi:hypothetical protein
MPQDLDFSGNRLWLHENCIYIQLGETDPNTGEPTGEQKSVVFDFIRKDHYTPQNDSARMILDLMTHDKGQGVKFDFITTQLKKHYNLTDPQAKDELNKYLNELNREKLLDFDDQAGVAPGVLKDYKDKQPKDDKNKALGKIKHGGTIICCGYTVTRYRP